MTKTKTKKSAKAQSKAAQNEEKTLVAFLLDRTGSMASVKQETIGGFNGYLDELAKKPETRGVTFHFTQFDSIAVEVINDCVPLAQVKKLTDETFVPRANTPLYDAIGKTIRAIEAKAKGYKVLFVTLTDGEENASSEWNQTTIKALIKEKETNDKWTFSYIGVGIDAWAANQRLAAGTIGASNVLRSTGKNTGKAFQHMAQATMMRCLISSDSSLQDVYHGAQLDKDDAKD